ncbi:MAG: hypothetical protein HOV81_19775 [Kofleriaceae bacterium]|nr:hypothetical protein [Kofleriaceae bacterium]
MKRTRLSACVFAVASSLAACHSTGDVQYSGEVAVTSPALVQVTPGVQVVEDADEPLFFADGSYWLYRDNVWLRSDNYRGGFARVDLVTVPQDIRVIERPQIYAHYRQNSKRYSEAYARDRERSTRGTAPAPMANPPPVSAPEQPHPQQQANPIPPSSLPPAANPEEPLRTPNDVRREPESQRNVPVEQRPDYKVPAPGEKSAPPPAAQTPPEDEANPTPPVKAGENPNLKAQGRHDDLNNSGNPDAPSKTAPVSPSNSPTTPSQSATNMPDRDQHQHGNQAKQDREDQATPPSDTPKSASAAKDKRDAKKKNEKY